MKIAIATTSEYEAVEFRKLLFEKYNVLEAEEAIKDDLHTGVYTTKESEWSSILNMFGLIKAITGINPYTQQVSYNRQVVKAKAIAAVILCRKYEMTFTNIAKILGYKSHASPEIAMQRIRMKGIKNMPTELAIRKLNKKVNTRIVKFTNIQVQ